VFARQRTAVAFLFISPLQPVYLYGFMGWTCFSLLHNCDNASAAGLYARLAPFSGCSWFLHILYPCGWFSPSGYGERLNEKAVRLLR